LIGGGLVWLGRHQKNNMRDYDNGGGVVTTTTTTKNEDGVFSIVVGNGKPPMGQLALSMPPRNGRNGGVLNPAPRWIVRGQHDPWTSGIREAHASRRLADFRLVLAVRMGG
jgi:hypothetical protein